MKTLLFVVGSLLLTAGCSSNPTMASLDESTELEMLSENDKLCENHKKDFQYFRAAFDKEHEEVCANGCAYTASMSKNSDTMERVAGLYYLMACDSNHGRL